MLTVCLSLLHLCPPLVGHGGVAFPAVKTRTGEVFENCSSYRQDTHTQASLCTEGCSSPQQSAGGAGRGELVVQSCLLHIPDTIDLPGSCKIAQATDIGVGKCVSEERQLTVDVKY